MTITLIILSILLTTSIVANFLLYKSGVRQLETNLILDNWIGDFKKAVQKTYDYITLLDSQNIFVKDDEVGVVFQEMVNLISDLNQKTQNDQFEGNNEEE